MGIMQDVENHKKKQEKLQQDIVEELKVGGSEEYCNRFFLFPVGKLPYPVTIPAWMFRKYPEHPDFELDDIEKVALAHVIHFTKPTIPTGYIECSGDIENVCKCSVQEAHSALQRLVSKNMITRHTLPPDECYGHKRNFGYYINAPYLHYILNLYGTDIWN